MATWRANQVAIILRIKLRTQGIVQQSLFQDPEVVVCKIDLYNGSPSSNLSGYR